MIRSDVSLCSGWRWPVSAKNSAPIAPGTRPIPNSSKPSLPSRISRFPANETLALIARKLRASTVELKKHDHRSALADLKRLAEGSPGLGAAVRALVEEVHSGKLTPSELAAKLRSVTDTK